MLKHPPARGGALPDVAGLVDHQHRGGVAQVRRNVITQVITDIIGVRPGPGERANAQLKTWHILRKLRCCPWKAGHIAKAIHVLQTRETGG
jgi:hypothetical protein